MTWALYRVSFFEKVEQKKSQTFFLYKGVTGANLGAPFFSKNWMEIQHGGTNKVANDVVE